MRPILLGIAALAVAGSICRAAEPDKAKSDFKAEFKKVQAATWDSGFLGNAKVRVQIRKDKMTVGMYDKGGNAYETTIPAEVTEDGEERVVGRKTDQQRLLSYEFDGKDLKIEFDEYLQKEFTKQGWDLPDTIVLKKGKR